MTSPFSLPVLRSSSLTYCCKSIRLCNSSTFSAIIFFDFFPQLISLTAILFFQLDLLLNALLINRRGALARFFQTADSLLTCLYSGQL